MKRIAGIGILAVVALIAIAYTAPTPPTSKKSSVAKTPAQKRRALLAPSETTFIYPYNYTDEGRIGIKATGEVLDLFCYLDRGFSGEVHRQCAYNCIHGGEPMGLLTRDGKVYILFMDHWYAMDRRNQTYSKVYDQCKEYAGLQVRVEGFLVKRKGLEGIELKQVTLVNEFAPPLPDSTGLKLRFPQ